MYLFSGILFCVRNISFNSSIQYLSVMTLVPQKYLVGHKLKQMLCKSSSQSKIILSNLS